MSILNISVPAVMPAIASGLQRMGSMICEFLGYKVTLQSGSECYLCAGERDEDELCCLLDRSVYEYPPFSSFTYYSAYVQDRLMRFYAIAADCHRRNGEEEAADICEERMQVMPHLMVTDTRGAFEILRKDILVMRQSARKSWFASVVLCDAFRELVSCFDERHVSQLRPDIGNEIRNGVRTITGSVSANSGNVQQARKTHTYGRSRVEMIPQTLWGNELPTIKASRAR